MQKMIPLSIPNFEGNEKKYVNEALDQGWVSTGGAYITRLEGQLASFLKTENVAACQSGTSALHLSLIEAGVGPGDVVLVPPLTFIAAVNPVRYQQAVPVFIDCDDSFCMDPVKLRSFCEEECLFDGTVLTHRGRAVKALIVVHVFGNMADMEAIMDIAGKYHLQVIEDATEALGTHYTAGRYEGRYAGTIGHFGAFSFNGNKIITGTSGGMLLTDDEATAKEVRKLSTQSRENAPWYQHTEMGYNYRMSNIVAGVVRGQLPHLDEHIAQKKAVYERYKKGLAGIPVTMNPFEEENGTPNYWLSCITVNKEAMCEQYRGDTDVTYVKEKGKSCPTEILDAMLSINAEGRPLWKPMHMQPIFAENGYVSVSGDTGADLFERGLCLPSDNKMTEEQQNRIIEVIRSCFE